MTDPRIEAAARALCRASGFNPDETSSKLLDYTVLEPTWAKYKQRAEIALQAADAAARARVVPFPIPDNRMETAKNTLLCWKGGALSDDDAIGMIVCGVSEPPASIAELGGVDGSN